MTTETFGVNLDPKFRVAKNIAFKRKRFNTKQLEDILATEIEFHVRKHPELALDNITQVDATIGYAQTFILNFKIKEDEANTVVSEETKVPQATTEA